MTNQGDVSNYTSVFRLSSSPPGDGDDDPKGDDDEPLKKKRRTRRQHHTEKKAIIKRNRQVVSCAPCRSRKIRCDRQQPCASCVRRRDEGACRFFFPPAVADERRQQQQASSSSSSSVSVSVPSAGGGGGGGGQRSGELRSRLRVLEDLVGGLVGAGLGARGQAGALDLTTPRTTDHEAALQCIRGLQELVDEDGAGESAAGAAAGDSDGGGSVQQQQQQQADKAEPCDGQQTTVPLDKFLERLPSRTECDGLLTYFFQQEYTIPIPIHTGRFQRLYEEFWRDPARTSILWLSILFSLLSISVFHQASRVRADRDDGGDFPPVAMDKIEGFSSMAHRCLVGGDYLQGGPHSVEAALVFGMHMVLQRRDSDPLCWHTIGAAVRLAQRMGYHRDATKPDVSLFEAEMRRRTWATLEYLDVVQSFRLGVPPITHGDHVDAQLPSNLRDDEFNEESTVLPPARPASDLTPILPSIHCGRQTKLLRRVIQQALAVTQPTYDDVKRLDAELRALHKDVPPGLRYRPIRVSGFADSPDVIVQRIMREVMHLKCMCILNRRYLTLERDNLAYDGPRATCRDASLRLLDIQAECDKQSREGGRLHVGRGLDMLDTTAHHDFLLAAVYLCLDVIAGSRNSQNRDHDHSIESLKRAREIWGRSTSSSKDASHATEVLDQFLSKVLSSNEKSPTSPGADGGYRHGTVSAWSTASGRSSQARNGSLQGRSMEWDFSLDNILKRTTDNYPGNLVHGVDWNHIDSLLLNREQMTGTSAAPAATPRDSREGWPYPTWKTDRGKTGEAAGPVHRVWAPANILSSGLDLS